MNESPTLSLKMVHFMAKVMLFAMKETLEKLFAFFTCVCLHLQMVTDFAAIRSHV